MLDVDGTSPGRRQINGFRSQVMRAARTGGVECSTDSGDGDGGGGDSGGGRAESPRRRGLDAQRPAS